MVKFRTYLICRIIFTLGFVIISTFVWFNRQVIVYHDVKNNLESNEIIVSNLKKLKDDDDTSYNLIINNKKDFEQDVKVYIVPTVLSNSAPNNYIKYQINDGNIKTLNMDGMIMVSKLDSFESVNLNLKLWISDTYDGILNYEGRVIVS